MSDAPRSGSAGRAVMAKGHLVVLDASPNAIVAVDQHGVIVYANPQTARTFGYEPAELIGNPVEMLLPERVAGGHVHHRDGFIARPVARPMGIGLDLAGRRHDGTEFPVEISLSPLDTPTGRQVFATIVDITARKTAEAQLLQAQKLESIGRLAGGIAHDFNNMLFAIRGYAEMLEEDLAIERRADLDPDLAHSNAAAITQVVERATLLTTQLLAFGRRGQVTPRVLSLNEATRSLAPMLHRLIGEQVSLTLALDETAGRVRVDAGQLDQILVNLVVNARDAMPDGGRVTIASGNVTFDEPYSLEHFDVQPGSYVMLAVSDTGTGMDRETRAHIFEPFFTTKQPGKGTGLGLATIYGIVRQAGGHIWLYSEPGQGSTFKLYLPRIDAPATDEAAPVAGSTPSRGTVLVVEDEPAVRDMTIQVLKRAGWSVVAVASGTEALTLVDTRAQPFLAVVSDVVMPGMSGIELAERVLDRQPGMRVVLLSGYTADTLDLERVVRLGVRFVSKPLSGRQLISALADPAPATA
jgi:two-component system, cell cycle sensor histidine kinase and response regulator CckA